MVDSSRSTVISSEEVNLEKRGDISSCIISGLGSNAAVQ